MGSFFHSVHIPANDIPVIRQTVESLSSTEGVKVWLSPARDGWVSFFPDDINHTTALCQKLSLGLGLPVLVTLVHDSDVFCYLLFERGEITEEFVSNPEFVGGAASAVRVPERIVIFPQAVETLSAVRTLLATKTPLFAEEQMTKFLSLLTIRNGLSSYDYLERGEHDSVLGWSEFVHLPDRTAEKARRKAEKLERAARKRELREKGILLYDSELVRKPKSFGRWLSRVHGSPPNSREFLVCGYNEMPDLMRWIPPAEPIALGAGCIPNRGSSLCFIDGVRLLSSISGGVVILNSGTGETVRVVKNAQGDPVAYDVRTGVAYLHANGTLVAIRLNDDEIIFSTPFQNHARMILLHPNQPHLIWTTQRTLGVTHTFTGKMLLELPLYNARLISKKQTQWRAETGVVPSSSPDVLEREDLLSIQVDQSGERFFAGTSEGLREYRYSEILSAKGRMPLPTAGLEVSEKLQDGRMVNSIALDERRTRVVYTSGDDSIRYYDWKACTTGVLKAPSEAKRIWSINFNGDTSRLLCHLGAGREEMLKRQDDHWVQVWDYERLCAVPDPISV